MAGINVPESLQSCLGSLSSVEVLWVSLAGSYAVVGLYEALTDDGSSGNQDVADKDGLLRFRKRPAKRWFLGLGLNSVLVFSMLRAYVSGVPAFSWISHIVESVSLPDSVESDRLSVILGSSMLTLHLLQKFHQSVFVNVYGNGRQGLLDFLSPLLYNGAVTLTLLSQAPSLTGDSDSWFDWSMFTWRHLLGTGLFVCATYQDHSVQPALANTRRNRAGHIVSIDHKVPKGGLYEIISCPSYFLTILNHIAMGVTLGCSHRAWGLCTVFVTVSHIVRALRRQRWYQLKFKDSTSSRKAIIPYVL